MRSARSRSGGVLSLGVTRACEDEPGDERRTSERTRPREPAPPGPRQGGNSVGRTPYRDEDQQHHERAPLHLRARPRRHPPVDPRGRRPARRGELGAARQRHHQPRRLDRVRDAGRGDARELVAARDRHRGLEVLPQGRPEGRSEEGRDLGPAARHPRGADHPRGGRAAGRLLRLEGGRRRVRGRADPPARDAEGGVQLAGVVQPRPLPALRHRGPGRQLGMGGAQGRGPRPRTPTSARSARPASSRPSTTT
jgi:hypothetical protein